MKKTLLLSLILVLSINNFGWTCTTFCLTTNGDVIAAGNYDWDIGMGLIMINKRNVSKMAMFDRSYDPAKWVSRYGSLTLNQYGREFPTAGMNETGLVVELMMLNDTEYPDNNLPVVGCLEWIQYQLDNSATVSEVLKNSSRIRIRSAVKLHFLVCDRKGASATVEFLNGRMTAHTGSNLPVAVLTNDTYENSLQYLRTLNGFGGSASPGTGPGSLERFGRAATWLRSYNPAQKPADYAFQILANVAQPGFTKWSMVYDLKIRRASFRSDASSQIKSIDLSKLDFDCSTPVKIMNVNTAYSGDVTTRLLNYTFQSNLNLIRQSYRNTAFLKDTPDAELHLLARHPETFACMPN